MTALKLWAWDSVIPCTEMGKWGWKVVFEKRIRNLHANITFNVLACCPGGNIYNRQLRNRNYIKNKIFKETKIGRGAMNRGRNDLRVRMVGQNKVPDTRGWQDRLKLEMRISSCKWNEKLLFLFPKECSSSNRSAARENEMPCYYHLTSSLLTSRHVLKKYTPVRLQHS